MENQMDGNQPFFIRISWSSALNSPFIFAIGSGIKPNYFVQHNCIIVEHFFVQHNRIIDIQSVKQVL